MWIVAIGHGSVAVVLFLLELWLAIRLATLVMNFAWSSQFDTILNQRWPSRSIDDNEPVSSQDLSKTGVRQNTRSVSNLSQITIT